MVNESRMYCFRANYERSKSVDRRKIPDWICIDTNWQGYKIFTQPWVADVARALGTLPIEDSLEEWITYLESIGLEDVTPVSCEDLFEDKGYF